MSPLLHRSTIVLDTNSLVRGLANRQSASGRILSLCETRNLVLLLSSAVVAEYRDVLSREEFTSRHRDITPEAIDLILRRLKYFSQFVRPRVRFRFDRDRRDEKFIELAIAGNATHLVTHDLDLLSLESAYNETANRFRRRLPGAKILTAADFLRSFRTMEN